MWVSSWIRHGNAFRRVCLSLCDDDDDDDDDEIAYFTMRWKLES